jgi:hypothetical protein
LNDLILAIRDIAVCISNAGKFNITSIISASIGFIEYRRTSLGRN